MKQVILTIAVITGLASIGAFFGRDVATIAAVTCAFSYLLGVVENGN